MGVFASLAAFSLGASVYRAGEAYDAKLAATKSANLPIAIAERTVREAKTDWIAKDNAVQRELARGGCGRICRARKESADDARRLYAAAKMKLAKLGAPRTADPMAARLASVFTISQELIGVFYPLTLPVGIWLASVVFIGLAVNEICGRQIGRALPISERKVNVGADADLPLGLRIRRWMDTQERLDGRRPTQREAAQHFKVSPSTVSRHLGRYSSSKSVGARAASKAEKRLARIAYECA